MLKASKFVTILAVVAMVSAGAFAAAPWDPAVPQVNVSGATLFKNFFTGAGGTNDWIDVDNDGLWGNMHPSTPVTDQLAVSWSGDFNNPAPTTDWIVNYRGVGSGNGLAEMLDFQAVLKAPGAQKVWYPIETYNGQNGSSYRYAYGKLPTDAPSDFGLTNRTKFAEEGNPSWTPTGLNDYANTSYIGVKQQSIDIGVMDVPTRWFVTQAGKAGTTGQNPGLTGYGNNPIKDWTGQQGNKLKSLTRTLVNPADPTDTYDVTFNLSSNNNMTVYDSVLGYVPIAILTNHGTDLQQATYAELNTLFTAGRMPTGENLKAATRDSGSGTRNGAMNSLGIDPSYGRGDNLGKKNKLDTAGYLGDGNQVSNLGGSGIMETAVSMNRLAVGYTGMERLPSKNDVGISIEMVAVSKDGVNYVNPRDPGTVNKIIYNGDVATGYQIGGPETMATVGDPNATTHAPTTSGPNGIAPTLTGNGNPAMANAEAALYVRNIMQSIEDFNNAPGGDDSFFMPGELMASKYFAKSILEAAPDNTNPSSWPQHQTLPTTPPAGSLLEWVLNNNVLAKWEGAAATNKAWGHNAAGYVPARHVGSYNDGGVSAYVVWTTTDGGVTYTKHTLAAKAQLSMANEIQGDFNGANGRTIDDLNSMVAALNTPDVVQGADTIPGFAVWAANQTGGDAIGTVKIPAILGDFNGDGDFDKDDVRYFADGLALNAAKTTVDRQAAFALIETLSPGFFPTGANAYLDLAGSGSDIFYGATPGADPNGADDAIDLKDQLYVAKLVLGALRKAPALQATPYEYDWSNPADQYAMDFAADVTQDGVMNWDDVWAFSSFTGKSSANWTVSGDADLDWDVDLTDLALLASNYGITDYVTWWGEGDFDGDGDTDLTDLALLASNYGWTGGSMVSVPEPATMGLLALGALGAIRRRRA